MPSQSEYLKKAINNHAFADAMTPHNATIAGWALTVYFYAGLHFIAAYLRSTNIECDSHNERSRCLRADPRLRTIERDYFDLQTLCWNARYGMNAYGKQEVEEAKQAITAIRSLIEALLK